MFSLSSGLYDARKIATHGQHCEYFLILNVLKFVIIYAVYKIQKCDIIRLKVQHIEFTKLRQLPCCHYTNTMCACCRITRSYASLSYNGPLVQLSCFEYEMQRKSMTISLHNLYRPRERGIYWWVQNRSKTSRWPTQTTV